MQTLVQMTAAYDHPERQGVADCSFYIKTGSCKFGPSCKFNHPPMLNGQLLPAQEANSANRIGPPGLY